MKMKCKVIFTGALSIWVLFLCLPLAYAQKAEDVFTLEEITVTSEKREVNVQDTAVSVAAIAGAEIRDKGIVQIDDALSDVAGVDVGGVLGGSVVFIRGVGSFVNTETNDPSTALILDGVYAERAEQVQGTMYDISRVEVLRGPQGTLYGRNAISGTVSVVSNSPSDRFEAISNFTIGDYNLKHADGALNIPISDHVATRLAFLRDIRDGYISNGANNSDKFSFRAKLSYKPADKISFLLTYERYEDNDCSTFTVPVPGSQGTLPPVPGMWAPDFDFTAGWVLPLGADEWTTDEWHTKTIDDMTFNTYTLQMDWDLEWGQLTFIPSYSQTYRTVGLDPVFGEASMDYITGELDKITYKGGFEYDISEDSLFYAHISTGYKAGGVNTTIPPDEFKPEELLSYEIGSKNRFLNDRLQVNMEAFYYNYEDMQVTVNVLSNIANTGTTDRFFKISNAETGSTSFGG